MRQPHNGIAHRLTNEAINPRPATFTLNLERFSAQHATTLHHHRVSLPIRCMGGPPPGERDSLTALSALIGSKKNDQLCETRILIQNHASLAKTVWRIPCYQGVCTLLPAATDSQALIKQREGISHCLMVTTASRC